MLTRLRALLPAWLLSFCAGCAPHAAAPPRVVPQVDLNRYTGTWYEVARFPNRFQKNCFGSTATYTLRADGKIAVVNRCRRDTPDGPVSSANGTARVVDEKTHAKLEVTFFWPFWGDYWIIDLGQQYEYAVVSGPDRQYLWILSRTPEMPPETYRSLVADLEAQGFDVGRLLQTAPAATPLPQESSLREEKN